MPLNSGDAQPVAGASRQCGGDYEIAAGHKTFGLRLTKGITDYRTRFPSDGDACGRRSQRP